MPASRALREFSERVLIDHAVIIASANRATVLHGTLLSIQRQLARPVQIILSVPRREDVPDEAVSMPGIEIVISERGLPIQRNTGLKFVAPQVSIVSFLDDDVELARDYLANIRSILDARSEIVLLDGAVVQDGNISRKEAIALLDQEKRSPGEHSDLRYASHAYGCNMTVRREVADRVLFDERLKLYAWLEDADFGRRCLAYGKCANAAAARIVHLAVKSGRVNSRQFGFAQIMNPYYLTKKGVVSRSSLLREHWWRALASNLLHLFRNDQEIDRIGRIKGNGLAWYLILRGRCEPEYIEKIQ